MNPFHATGLFPYPLKPSKTPRFSIFRRYRKRPLVWNRLRTAKSRHEQMEEFFWHLNSQSWASMRGPYFLIRFKLNFKVSQPSITRYVDFVSCILAKNPQALLYIFAMRLHRRCLTGSQIHLWAAWTRTSFNSQAIWLKIPGSDLTRKVENKCMNVCERVEVVGRNKESPLPSRCPMNYQGLKKFWQKSFPSFLPWQAILFDFKHEYSKNYLKRFVMKLNYYS